MNYKILLLGLVVIGALIVTGVLSSNESSTGGPTANQLSASSTSYTLTTSSQRVLASSTQRVAAEFQSVNCTGGGTAYLNTDGNDVAATVANGDSVVFASSTKLFSDEEGNPPTINAITGILDSGTCMLKVTEWQVR